MEGYYDDKSAKAEEEIEDKKIPREISESVSPQDTHAAPPINWNAVSATKIRTSLGGSVGVGNAKAIVTQPGLADGARKEAEGYSNRDLGGLILFLVTTFT